MSAGEGEGKGERGGEGDPKPLTHTYHISYTHSHTFTHAQDLWTCSSLALPTTRMSAGKAGGEVEDGN